MASDEEIIARIIRKYGSKLDLEKHPEAIIDIIRTFEPDDGGLPPGGAPNPPPGPSSRMLEVTNDELMREVLKLAREVASISRHLGVATAK
jgi:hypothetical protein